MNGIIKIWTITTGFLGRWKAAVFVFFVLTLTVTFPLFIKPGFVFLLDLAPTPQPSPTQWGIVGNSAIFNYLWMFLHFLLPGGFLQKMLLASSLFLAGFGMFRLGVHIRARGTNNWGGYFAGIFYMFNPFVYSRAITGQWNIITAYALFPWLFLSLLYFFKRSRFVSACRVALWCTAIILLNIHIGLLALLMTACVSFFAIMFSCIQSRRRGIKCGGWVAVLFAVFLVVNSYWIGPGISGKSTLGHFAEQVISRTDIFSFFTRPDPVHGVFWNTAAMYGFWGDEDQRYVSQKIFVSHWFYLFFAILALVIWGVVVSVRNSFRQRAFSHHQDDEVEKRPGYDKSGDSRYLLEFWMVLSLVLTGLVALFFAVGVSYEPFKSTVLWLYEHVPFLKGFREPQKFVALLVFVYAIFSAIGVNDLLTRIEGIKNTKFLWFKLIAPGFFLLVPLIYSPGMLWGFHGQITPAKYPASWFAVDRLLQRDQEDFATLFLPWHQYIYLAFAKTVISNPAEQFFSKPIIAGDNMEFGPIYTQSTRPESKYVEQTILKHKADFLTKDGKGVLSLGRTLLPLKIKYIIMAKDSDAFNYTFVENSQDMQLVYNSAELAVYENLIFIGPTQKPDLSPIAPVVPFVHTN